MKGQSNFKKNFLVVANYCYYELQSYFSRNSTIAITKLLPMGVLDDKDRLGDGYYDEILSKQMYNLQITKVSNALPIIMHTFVFDAIDAMLETMKDDFKDAIELSGFGCVRYNNTAYSIYNINGTEIRKLINDVFKYDNLIKFDINKPDDSVLYFVYKALSSITGNKDDLDTLCNYVHDNIWSK
jgi:hypothetical protein